MATAMIDSFLSSMKGSSFIKLVHFVGDGVTEGTSKPECFLAISEDGSSGVFLSLLNSCLD